MDENKQKQKEHASRKSLTLLSRSGIVFSQPPHNYHGVLGKLQDVFCNVILQNKSYSYDQR